MIIVNSKEWVRGCVKRLKSKKNEQEVLNLDFAKTKSTRLAHGNKNTRKRDNKI